MVSGRCIFRAAGLLVLLYVGCGPVDGFLTDCHEFCRSIKRNTTSAELSGCNCLHILGIEAKTTETPTTTPIVQHVTQNVCDYLCSIQEGGSACDCSRPVVPGK